MALSQIHAKDIVKLFRTNELRDNTKGNVFKIKLNNDYGKVHYQIINDVYDLQHSSIPDQYQGKGLGSILAERVFDHLVSKKKKFKPTCEFLQSYYLKNENKYKQFVNP